MAETVKIDIFADSSSIKELKQQLLETRNQLSGMDASSEDFAKVAQRAGEIKDQMKDINEQVAIFAGGSKFEQAGTALGQVKDALFSLDFKGAAEKASSLNTIIKGISFKEATAGLGDLGKTFLSLGKTLLTNPLFLIPAAIIGIISALGLLGPIIDTIKALFQGLSEAASDFLDYIGLSNKKFDELKKKREEQAEATKKQAEATKKEKEELRANARQIAESQVAYVSLIDALSKTNKNSKERSDLIKTINSQYGTTLTNINDEKKFQDQLNTSLNNYLELKRKEFIQKSYAEKLTKALTIQEEARQTIINELRRQGLKYDSEYVEQVIKGEVDINKLRAKSVYDKRTNTKVSVLYDTLEIEKAREKYNNMTGWQVAIQNESDKTAESMKNLGFVTTENNKGTEAEVKINNELLQTLNDLTKKNEEYGLSEEDLAKLQKTRRDKEIEAQFKLSTDADKDAQRTKALAQSKITYDNQVKDINNKNIEAKKQKEKELKDFVENLGKTTLELRKEQYDGDLAKLDEALNSKLIDEEEYFNKSEALRLAYEKDKKAAQDAEAAATKALADEQLNNDLKRIESRKEKIKEYIDLAQNISDAFFVWGDRKREDEANDELSKYKEGTVEYENAKKKQTEIAEKAAERQFNINKAFQLGSAINDATGAILTSLKSSPPVIGVVPNPAGIAALAFVTATGIANVAKIAASRYKGSTATNSNGNPNLGSVTTPAQPSFQLFGNPNQANTVNASNESPIQTINVNASVSVDEITKKQSKMVKIVESGTL
jgi:hypothetical protein